MNRPPEGIEVQFNSDPDFENRIERYFHCLKCARELPVGMSPRDYQRIQVGMTDLGSIQVWCVRHDCNVVEIVLWGEDEEDNGVTPAVH